MKSGETPRYGHRSDLGSRDRRILADVIRFRLTTNELIQLAHLSVVKANAVTKVTSRLVRTGWLAAHPLVQKRTYFVPGPRLVRQFGLPAARVRPLGPQALATSIAIASYCAKATPRLTLLTGNELEKSYSWIPAKLRSVVYATAADDSERLFRCIRIDLGGTPDHVAIKCQHDADARANVTGFRDLLAAKSLLAVVLTASDTKKALIEDCLRKRSWPAHSRFQVVVIDELFQLIGA